MNVDLYLIKKGQMETKYFPTHRKNYNDQKQNIQKERRKKGSCFICGETGHMQFNCSNKKKPKNFKVINKVPTRESSSSTLSAFFSSSVRRIKKLKRMIMSTNKFRINSGSDINFIHPEFARVNNFELMNIVNSFKVVGLGYGLSTVKKISEKCILRFKNHHEIIQLYSLRIPDVDIILGLPWIEKHCLLTTMIQRKSPSVQDFVFDTYYLDDFVISYIDDILIYSKSLKEHHIHVKKVLKKLLENNLYVKLEKCEYDISETTFLGYILSKDGLKVDPNKIKAILDWLVPTTVKEVQSFISLYNYYRIFIKDFAKIARPLHKLTRKNVSFNWGSDQQKAFDKLKELFTSASIFRNPDSNKHFVVETDASNFAVDAILSQEFDDQLHPIAYISSSLTKSEKKYPIYDKELLTIKVALEE
eukprot:jgi/Orpsp1_1/1179347/evm.model.c7180000068960.2